MKKENNGIEKEVDKLGRVVLPMNFRKKLGIESNSKVMISMDDNTVLIRASENSCSMCKRQTDINLELGLCPECIEKVKNYKI